MAIYFTVGESGSDARFVIRLDSSEKIAHARAILDGSETLRVHVQGTIVRAPAPYNPTWSFHLDPASIDFFAMAIRYAMRGPNTWKTISVRSGRPFCRTHTGVLGARESLLS
jgi:hypothetical protein